MTAIWGGEGTRGRVGGAPASGPAADRPHDLVGESQAFLNALSAVRRLLEERAPVLLLMGESGTGKTVFARAVHHRSATPADPFLTLQCSLLAPELIEPELFGAEAGALPGQSRRKPGLLELAGRGTVFLDDVEVLPPPLQRRLVDALRKSGPGAPVGRVVAASRFWPAPGEASEPLQPEFHGFFHPFAVELPPLRKRERDLELLVRHFLERWAAERNAPVPSVDADAIAALYAHPWPGNVRELRTTIERAARLAPGPRIRLEHLQIQTREHRSLARADEPAPQMIRIPPIGKPWEAIEREALEVTLHLAGGNRSAAARMLRLSRGTLNRKLRKYGLD